MNRAKPQNGFILMPVIIAIVLVATIAFMLNNQSSFNVDETGGMQDAEQAENIARAGIAHATWTAQYSGCAGDMTMATVPFGAGSYSASIDAAATSTTSYSLNPDYDSYIRETNPDTNFGSESGIFLGPARRGLLHFDLSAIPSGSRVVTATLWLYFTTNDPADAVNIHPVNTAWTEAGATWNNMATAYNSEVLGVIPPQPVPNAWVAINLTALAQSWVNDAAANYGLMLLVESITTDSRFASRENPTAAQRPYLQITTADGAVSPLQISASGNLTGNPSPSNDITRTLTRSNVPAYQTLGKVAFQLGTDPGEDGMPDSFYSNRNYGGADYMQVHDNGSDWQQYPVLRFDLARLPKGAVVRSARLELSLQNLNAPGTATIHQVTRSWVEGTKSGGGIADGATWLTHDGSNAWTSAGGDINALVVAETAINGGETWVSWEIAPLVQRWLAGEPNHGLQIRPDNGLDQANFASKENASVGVQPKLTITYACECGSSCLAPQGSGTVAMVVVDPTTLVPADAYKKALFESWGYTVNLISENTNAAGYMTAADSNDVFYISETVNSGQVGTRIKDVPIGVVSEDGDYNGDLGFATGSAYTVGSALNVTDISHYITAVFATGSLDIYTAGMEQLTVSGTEAAGLQTLADSGGAGSLVVLDQGADMASGGTAAGRRVMLPLGTETKFNWDYLTGNGRLLVQRALQWGMETGDVACAAENAADDFETGDYTGGTGSIAWNGDWQEFGESDGPNAGDFRVLANALCTTGQCLQIREDRAQSRQIMRQVDLSGAVSASLSFSYRWRQVGSPTSGSVTLEASGDGGASFTPVKVYTFNTSTAPLVDTVDISDFIGATTQIRFSTSDTAYNTTLYVDDLDIVTSCTAAPVLTPLAHWKLDETSGTTAVDSVGGHDGTLTNGPTWDTGQVDGALNFDGGNDYVNVPHDPGLNLASALTISTWFRADSFGSGAGGYRTFVSKYPNSTTANYWFGTWQDELVFGFWSGGTWYEVFTSGLSLDTDQWYQAAVSFDDASDQVLLYINGAQVFAGSIVVSPPVNSGAVTIGRSAAGEYWDGLLDDIRIYDEVLTSTDIEELAALGGGGGGGDGGPGYYEAFALWSATANDTWETVDLSAYGVPANAVVEVAVTNSNTGKEYWGGVRAVGSSLDRRFQLHEAEGGGVDAVVMHVQADASSQIQHYSDVTARVTFTLLGYWVGPTYVERFDVFKAGANASWQAHNLGSYGVGPNQVAEIAISNKSTSIGWLVGTRHTGSSLQRRVSLHRAEAGGVDVTSMQVEADASSMVEVYAGATSVVDFHLLGYWSIPPGTYTEAGGVSGQVSTLLTWEAHDLSSFGVPANSVAQFIVSNESNGADVEIGVRETGSILQRKLNLQEAEGEPADSYAVHVNVDSSSQVEWYAQYGGSLRFFYPIGWWVLP